MNTTTTRPAKQLRIWIELDKPIDKADADLQCELANNMLARLNGANSSDRKFWYSEHERRYCYGGHGGYNVLSDSGEWFNLTFFGRPADQP